ERKLACVHRAPACIAHVDLPGRGPEGTDGRESSDEGRRAREKVASRYRMGHLVTSVGLRGTTPVAARPLRSIARVSSADHDMQTTSPGWGPPPRLSALATMRSPLSTRTRYFRTSPA